MFYLFWVFVCFFAVIGILECLLGVLKWLSFRRVRAVSKITLQVFLSGTMQDTEYLLNSLCLMAEKNNIGSLEAGVDLVDDGIDPRTCEEIRKYCEKNPWVIFTERAEDDIIN